MENSFEYYCLNIIVIISFFSSLNTNVNTNLKYYRREALIKKVKLRWEAMKNFLKIYNSPRQRSPS